MNHETQRLLFAAGRGARTDPQDECSCKNPLDNDMGFCMGCGLWINYRSKDAS